jgi:hypothetical protein
MTVGLPAVPPYVTVIPEFRLAYGAARALMALGLFITNITDHNPEICSVLVPVLFAMAGSPAMDAK